MSDIPITERFAAANTALPLVAILRGIQPHEAIAKAIAEEGYTVAA